MVSQRVLTILVSVGAILFGGFMLYLASTDGHGSEVMFIGGLLFFALGAAGLTLAARRNRW